MNRLDEIRDKIKELCEEYEIDSGILIIIEDDNTGEKMVSGNMCPVCARDLLVELVLESGIKHKVH